MKLKKDFVNKCLLCIRLHTEAFGFPQYLKNPKNCLFFDKLTPFLAASRQKQKSGGALLRLDFKAMILI